MEEKLKLPKHIHIYKRINVVPSWKSKLPENHKYYRPKHELFVCQAPTCTNTLELNKALGKLNACNVCHRPFLLDKESIQRAKPRCQDCIVRKLKAELTDLADYLEDI